MVCMHPHCPMGEGLASWNDVVAHPYIRVPAAWRQITIDSLDRLEPFGVVNVPLDLPAAVLARLLYNCPCLFSQWEIRATARAVVHLCEVTLGQRIVSANVYEAFLIQHPDPLTPPFLNPPLNPGASGGDIMEMLCSEVLTNHGLPLLETNSLGWPVWDKLGHVSLNNKKLRAVKAFGDILIPCAPSNLVISVKSEAAKERLLYSANMIEGVGFGFFKHAAEFWTPSRMILFKRMGFSAIYMPDPTFATLSEQLEVRQIQTYAVNVNGTSLYRPLSQFGDDMARVAGKLSLIL